MCVGACVRGVLYARVCVSGRVCAFVCVLVCVCVQLCVSARVCVIFILPYDHGCLDHDPILTNIEIYPRVFSTSLIACLPSCCQDNRLHCITPIRYNNISANACCPRTNPRNMNQSPKGNHSNASWTKHMRGIALYGLKTSQ